MPLPLREPEAQPLDVALPVALLDSDALSVGEEEKLAVTETLALKLAHAVAVALAVPLPLPPRDALMAAVDVPPTAVAEREALEEPEKVPCDDALPCMDALALALAQGEGVLATLALSLASRLAVAK